MVWVDVYSRRAWVFGMKNKTTSELMRVNEDFLREYRPYNVTFDREPGIKSKAMDKLFKTLDIQRWHPKGKGEFKGATAIVERFNLTCRSWITKFSLKHKSYINDLEEWVGIYNNTWHRTIKTPPNI